MGLSPLSSLTSLSSYSSKEKDQLKSQSEENLTDPSNPGSLDRTHESEILNFSRYSSYHPLINFGVMEKGQDFHFYRSSLLGKWGLKILQHHLEKSQLPFPKSIIYMHYEGYQKGFPLLGKFAREEDELQIKYGYQFFHPWMQEGSTYLSGFNPYNSYDGKMRKEKGLLHLKDDPRGHIHNFYRILNLILDKDNHPILFHCFAGKHRTGMVALALRYLQGGKWIHGEKQKIFSLKYQKSFELNPAQYEYFLHNRNFFRLENVAFVEEFYERDPVFQMMQIKYKKNFLSPD